MMPWCSAQVFWLRHDGMVQVFCWGSGRDGQLGLGEAGAKTTPQEVPDLEDMQHIAAGGNVRPCAGLVLVLMPELCGCR